MANDESSAVILQWVKSGPGDNAGTLGYLLGWWLWWRTWAFMALLSAPLFAGFLALSQLGGVWGVLVTFVVAGLTGTKQLQVSPKYNVSKNY